ncbi:MAG: hypothetical protein GXY25_10865 [Pirellulaceae bacterium]|nr:hypothetical protein [Thermoguttaceae bacterium]NLZ01029.1 hypothetical protein [Pirellulaceae bacterium]
MSLIHQLYCTHCTHGSSALERSQGEMAARMLGYSVRAGSLEGERLRRLYRQVERYISYHLPRDTPGQAKLEWTAAAAPRRLVFIPSAGRLQVIALVSYRQRDSAGRPGSYFAHVLCREPQPTESAWTAAEALRLWNAPGWVAEDAAEHPFVLPALARADLLLGGASPAIDDGAFLRFLQGGGGAEDAWLPERWRQMPARQRAAYFQRVLGGLIAAGTARRQTVFLAVEPEVAALLFYGAARLVPPGDLSASIGVSTFEPNADRLVTALAATTFHDPRTAEFRIDGLRGCGTAINTFRDPCSEGLGQAGYAPAMIRRLLDDGWESVDQHLKTIAAAGCKRIEALEDFARTARTVAVWFGSPETAAGDQWRKRPEWTDFARRLVLARLGGELECREKRPELRGRASLATIVELAAATPPGAGPDGAIRWLLDCLAEPQVEPLLRLPEVAEGWKVQLLVRRIEQAGRMPSGCEWIWDDDPPPGAITAEKCRELGVRVLLGLNSRLVAALPATLQSPRFENLVDRLLDACDRDPARWAVLGEIVGGMTDGALIAVWRRCGTRWIASAEHDGGVLAGRLQAVLRTLPEHAAEFAQRYALVDAGRRHLSDPVDQKRLAAWDACREAICDLAPAAEKVGGWSGPLLVRRLEAAARRMAESAAAAMPPSEFPDDARSTRKQECLRTIGAQLLAGRALLPESEWHNQALWKKVCWRFEMGSWPSIPLRKLAFGNDPNRFWIGAGIAAAVLLGVLVIIGLASIGTGKRRSKGIVLERRAGRVADRHHAAGPSLPPEPAAPRDWPGPATPQSAAASGLEPVGPQPSTAAEAIDSGPTDAPSASGSNSVAGSPRRPEGTEPLHRLAPSAAQSAPPTGDAALEPLTPIDGVFKVEQSAALELPPPAIASVRLVVKSAGGRPLPDRILKHATIGAMIVEQGDFHASRYIELRNLAEKRDAEVFDGTEHLLVSFWFALAAGGLADRVDPIVATSCAQAEIAIAAGSHYEVRFELEQPAVDQLEAIVEEQVLRRHVQ